MHPLATLSLQEAFSTLACCLCCFNKRQITDDEKELYKEALKERDGKLNALIKALGGKYKGRNFERAAKKELNISASSSSISSHQSDDDFRKADAEDETDKDPLD